MIDDYANRSWYLRIDDFIDNQTKVIFDTGRIYKITIPFTEKDATEFVDESRGITVEAEVLDWTIVNAIQPY